MNIYLKRTTPICHYCGRCDCTKRHGTGRTGLQRYYCMNCRRTFQTTYVYKGKEQNIAAQVERLWAQKHTPEQISFEMQVRLATVQAHIKLLEEA
ncbi:hypothetical protein I2494_08265 [Budviciaceae bacterium BWR-B9]|uniref:IS1 family transposase n=1 Tax=Limnobaculum allomyrinae TaxID=2791986 RepID=A0ABS1IPL6_9GAMM|nr:MULTISPECIES: hypothetical protein [Limnobaculum]MBK5143708.1 hypothetical protein [Limnobaculum allomyrinae]MBV7693447.1 hypothetical protein [Limnobaculum sp. M2-1]